jgi:hypothetical protein
MKRKSKNDTCNYPATMDDLIDAMQVNPEKYEHLQIILGRDNTGLSRGLGQEYLLVNKIGFGIYQLNHIEYINGIILMALTNSSTGNRAEITLDINNEHPEPLLIYWNDIKEMVIADNNRNVNGHDLLDFDYDSNATD